ncbi:dynein axonemal assembly factor 8 isoform X2 [Gracilinanus agilis]|uniref:dynein axonemal assembly factor 8 isoform X2 n=1 Tax=Gracilinanus agilis TaxID=191870 RepID=UPI001CFF07D4|nr:dynein axonemal assembly factor 8 isoform X2 [Gracilinanus agilis]
MTSKNEQDLIGYNQFPCLYHTSMWGSILASVKEQLPSFDSDSSSSDSEDGELFIFQRDEENLIPDLTEELADDPDIQLLESVTNIEKNWNEIKDSAIFEGKDASEFLVIRPAIKDTEEIPSDPHLKVPKESTKWQKGDTWDFFRSRAHALIKGSQVEEFPTSACPTGLLTDNLRICNFSPSEESDSSSIKVIRKERRKMIEKNILHKEIKVSPLENLNYLQFKKPEIHESSESIGIEEKMPAKHEGLTLRYLEKLEEWDLDKILQNLEARKGQGKCTTGATYWKVHSSFKDRGSLTSKSQEKLMEQLVALCAKQSQNSLPVPHEKPSDKLFYPIEDQIQSRSSWCRSPLTPGQCQDVAKDTKLKWPVEPPTVFIDLRQPEPQKSVPLPQSDYKFQNQEDELSSSDSSTENEEETPDERDEKGSRKRVSQRPRDHTGKSYLLQQLRAFQRETAEACGPETKVAAQQGHSTQNLETSEDVAMSGIRKKQLITRESQENTSGSLGRSKHLPLLDPKAKQGRENQKGTSRSPGSERFTEELVTPLTKKEKSPVGRSNVGC